MEGRIRLLEKLENTKSKAIKEENYELALEMKKELDVLYKSNIDISEEDVIIILEKLSSKDRIEVYKELVKGDDYFLKKKIIERNGFFSLGQIDIDENGKITINKSDQPYVDLDKLIDEYDEIENPTDDDFCNLYANITSSIFGLDPEELYKKYKKEGYGPAKKDKDEKDNKDEDKDEPD